MSKIYTVYKAECKATGAVYFGTTGQRLRTRIAEHRSNAKRGSPMRVHEAMRLHGVDAFEFHEIAQCNNKPASWETERIVIAEAMAAGLTLLNTYDGQGCPKGTMPSRKAVEASIKAIKGFKRSASNIANLRAALPRGSSHYRHNPTIYKFTHPKYGDAFCTQSELRVRFGLFASHISNLCSGKVQCTHGWTIKKRPNKGPSV